MKEMGLEVHRKDIANIFGEIVRHESMKVAEWLFEYAGVRVSEESKQL